MKYSRDQILLGKYKVISFLGEGGMGSTYLVYDETKKERVALKILNLKDQKSIESFKKEFFLLSKFRHPNLVSVIDYGQIDSSIPFYTMEYVEGTDIFNYFLKVDPFDFEVNFFYKLCSQILLALDYIHNKNVVHGDIKPENILIHHKPGEKPIPKILDFGLSQSSFAEHKEGLTGSIGYVSPEKIRGEIIDGRSDLYSIGIVFYEILTGKILYQGNDTLSILKKHLFEEIHTIDSRFPVSEEFIKVILRLLRKNIFDRYQRAFNAANDISILYGEQLKEEIDFTKDFYFISGTFTGRESELNSLVELAESSKNNIAVIKGDYGSGKSRLIKEFRIRTQLSGYSFVDVKINENEIKPLAPVYNLVNELKGLLTQDFIQNHSSFLNLFDTNSNTKNQLPSNFDEIGFIFNIIDLINNASQNRKVILSFDDIHLADSRTIEFLEYLIRSILIDKKDNILLVISYQIDCADKIDSLNSQIKDNSLQIELRGIDKENIRKYIESSLNIKEIPDRIVEKIYDETSGNFLFVEEILKTLLEEKIIYFESGKFKIKTDFDINKIPITIIDAFKSRLNKFTDDEKECLYKLSVFIEKFDEELVSIIWNNDQFEVKRLIDKFEKEGLLNQDNFRYSFRSQKIKSSLYDELEKEKKKAIHHLIADYYKSLLTDNKAISIELLAYHLYNAERYGEAIPLLIKSGDKAKEIFANLEAEDFYKKAIFAMEKIGEKFSMNRYNVYLKLFDIYDLLGRREDGLNVLGNMQKIAEKYINDQKLSDVMVLQSKLFNSIGEYEKAKSISEKAVTIKDRIDDKIGKANALISLGSSLFRLGEIQKFIKCYEEAIEIFEKENSNIEYGSALVDLGVAYWSNLDTPEKAIEYYQKALEIFEEEKYLKGKLRAIGNTALAYFTLGKLDLSLEYHLKAKEICEKIGNMKGLNTALVNIGNALITLGKYSDAFEMLNDGLKLTKLINDKFNWESYLTNLGILHGYLGLYEKAIDYFNEALELSKSISDINGIILFNSNIALNLINLGKPQEAKKYIEEAEKYVNENIDYTTKINFLIPKIHYLLYDDALFSLDNVLPKINQLIELAIQSSDLDSELYAYSLLSKAYYKAGDINKALEESQRSIRKLNELKNPPIDYQELLWNHYLILKSRKEKRLAEDILKKAYEHVINVSRNITDLKLRESFLTQAFPNKEIIEEYKKLYEGFSFEDSTAKIKLNNLETLYRITQKIISILDIDELLNTIMDLALETLKGERGMIFLLENGDLKLKVARNVEKQTVLDASEISYSVIKDVASGGKPILTMDAMGDEKLMQRQSIMDFNIKSLVCVPIKLKDKILGTVYVDSTGKTESIVAFTNIDLEFLEAFAGIVGISIENARLLKDLKDENVYLRNEVEEKYKFENIIGKSEALNKVYKIMEGAIKSEGPVLIQGESGTGKELIAKAIHFNSSRKKERFVAVDCAALHETLLDSELFGHKKGSFTGAIQDKKGLFEEADKGTIFLDEITNTSLAFQAKLLRVLQEGEIRRVGDTESKSVDVRVIAAANRNLEEEVKAGRFREDLFYRLNVIPIFVPPLRERKEDIPLLINHFVQKYQNKSSKVIKSISQELIDKFMSYDWPGNIRELENIINRMIIFAEEEKLSLKDIPADFLNLLKKDSNRSKLLDELTQISDIKELEKEHILKTLEKTKGNKTEAAKLLGLKRTTLIERMKKYGLMSK